MTVTYSTPSDSDGIIEAIYEGTQIAGLEPGGHDGQNSFDANLPGFTVSYGRGFERAKWFSTVEAAKAWVESNAGDLLDY